MKNTKIRQNCTVHNTITQPIRQMNDIEKDRENGSSVIAQWSSYFWCDCANQ